MSSDLHLTLHEGDLWVQLAQAHFLEVVIGHRESSVGFRGLSFLAESLTILQVDLVDERRLGPLLCRDLEGKDGVDLGNEGLTVTLSQISCHHSENLLRLEP